MTDIVVNFQAIKDEEIGTNNAVSNQGVITFTQSKILLGIGNGNIDYVDTIKTYIDNSINNIDVEVPPLYNGTKTTEEITNSLTDLANSFVFNTTTNNFAYIPKDATTIDNVLEIPITGITVTYAEQYVAGENIVIKDRPDGMKEISAPNTNFNGFNVYSQMPTYEELAKQIDNMVYFVF